MMIHKIDKQSIVANATGVLRGVITNQDVNGLIIAVQLPSQWGNLIYSGMYGFQAENNHYLSVTLKSSKHQSEVLVNRINLRTLSDISDIEFGLSNFANSFVQAQDKYVIENIPTMCYAVVVPLGMLKNIANDSSLEVVLEIGVTADVGPVFNFPRVFGLYTYQDKEGLDYFLSYIQSNVLTSSFKDVDKLYLAAPVSAIAEQTQQDLNLNILLRHGGQAVSSDWLGVCAATFGLGRIEMLGPISTAKIFDRADEVVNNVDVVISGQTNDFSLVSVSRKRDVNRVSRSTIQVTEKTISELKKDIPRYKSLKRAGVVPSMHVLEAGRQGLNIPADKKGGSSA